jgi:NTP pyrophosphatase (non-canonical NTP hydrolase)
MVSWSALQSDVGTWAKDNFGEQPAVNPFLGTAEEIGELTEYLLTEDISAGSEEELDAVGDILVFFADFCDRHGFSYSEAAEMRSGITLHTDCESVEDFCTEVAISRGNQAYSILKQDQGIRLERDGVGPEADVGYLAHTLKAIEVFSNNRGYSLEEAIEEAWGEVKDREWNSSYK